MMLSRPVLLGFIWSLLFHTLRGQPQISSQENKVYAYSYHFQHNGTTNSKDILRTVLGTDGEFDFDGKSIIKTFSSPNIRGFFTKGILPAGPISHSFNSGLRSSFNSNSAISNIRNVIQSNLQPPTNTRNLLPPISPDIRNEFPGDFNNINDIGHNIYKTEEFPKISTLAVLQNQDDFPTIPPIPTIPSLGRNDFPKIPSPPPISPIINNDLPIVPHHDNGVNRVENFERNTPNGGKVFGQIETFSYNPPPVINTHSNYHENSQGFRRNENFVNDNQEVTGHRTQSYFRQQFRTVTPNLESNTLTQNNRFNNRNNANIPNNHNNNNNQWWNVLNVLGNNRNNIDNSYNNNNDDTIFNRNGPGTNNENIVRNNVNSQNLAHQIDQNIKEIKNNLNKNFRSSFGARLSNSNNRQNYVQNNNQFRQNSNNVNRNQDNFNNNLPKQNDKNLPLINIPFNNNHATTNNNFNTNEIRRNSGQNPINNLVNQHPNDNIPRLTNQQQNHASQINNELSNNQISNNQQNFNNQFKNDDTTRRVLNIINDVNSRLNNAEKISNDVGITWDDAIAPVSFNSDWSRRQSFGGGRSFSNGHSSPLINLQPNDLPKTSIDNIINDREINIPPISDIGNNRNNYRNIDGGGMEKFFNFNKVVEGPNSFSQNQRRGFERNFRVNSNTGYQHTNQWSTNTVRRLDAQSTRDDFSKDFIDVFRDDY